MSSSNQIFSKVLACIGFVLIFFAALSEVQSFDVFWQLQSGKYILQNKTFIYQDLFSIAAETPRWEHCWLHDVTIYLVYLLGGYTALSVLKGGLVALTAFVLVSIARIRKSSWLSILTVGFPLYFLADWAWLDRPQLWSFLCFALLLLLIEKFNSESLFSFLLIPLLMVFWANLHGGVLIAFPVLLAYVSGLAVDSWIIKRSEQSFPTKRVVYLVMSVFLACLVTPYGIQLYQNVLLAANLAAGSSNIIQVSNIDWRATTFNSFPKYYYAVVLGSILMFLGRKRDSSYVYILLVGLAFVGFKLERHTTFYLYAAAAFLPSYLDHLFSGLWLKRYRVFHKRYIMIGGMCFFFILLYSFSNARQGHEFFKAGLKESMYPVAATKFLKTEALPGNLFNGYGYGGYLMWQLFPDYKVFWDGRSTSSDMYTYGRSVLLASSGWESILEKFSVNTVLVEPCSYAHGNRIPLIDALRSNPRWALVFTDMSAVVFVRKDSVAETWLKQHSIPNSALDDAIFAMAQHLVKEAPWRSLAYFELARIYFQRNEFDAAVEPLMQYLRRTPDAERKQEALQMHSALTRMLAEH